MTDSNSENSSKIPAPSDAGVSGIQKNTQELLVISNNASGSISTSPITHAFEVLAANTPQQLGAMPPLVVGIIQENMLEKRRLDAKLNERETFISTQNQEIARLRESNAELKTALNAESRTKLLRNASITVGMLIIGVGFKFTDKQETLPYGVGLIVLGAVLGAFGWFTRAAKEVA
ncbi:MAG: hypothetical protein Q7U91_05145 [Sideroxyarcus sp.]|nr:hypothetical protein [Sideroxyarcus sp.]